MKKQDKKLNNVSHNVYYTSDHFRIRIYRNDHKYFEKQITLPKMHYFSISQEIQDILLHFIEKLDTKQDELEDYYLRQTLNRLNSAYLFADMLRKLREKEPDSIFANWKTFYPNSGELKDE